MSDSYVPDWLSIHISAIFDNEFYKQKDNGKC